MNEQSIQGLVQEKIEMAQQIYTMLIEYAIKYGFQILYGLVLLFIGIKLGGWASKLFMNFGKKKNLDVTLTQFIAMILRIVVILFVGMMAIEKFGITISPLIAAISATIFGASFALQAPLANYAAGLSIIFSRPFKVGDTITVKEFNGVIEEIKLPYTMLSTPSGERITIPNKQIVGEVITNSREIIMVDKMDGVSYADDPDRVIELCKKTVAQFSEVLKDPAPLVGIDSFGDSSVNIRIRFWVQTKIAVPVRNAVNLAIFKAIRTSGVTIPFPQREVRLLNPAS